MLKGAFELKRESGENPLQPPLLYTATNPHPLGNREGWRRLTREPGDLPLRDATPSEGREGMGGLFRTPAEGRGLLFVKIKKGE